MSEKHTVCLLNDSFPPIIDGVSNVLVNYARIIENDHGHAIVVTPDVPGADDSVYDFPVVRYPSIDTRKFLGLGYVTGYPFSPETAYRVRAEHTDLLHVHCPMTSCLLARQLSESMQLPLILTWHTKYDIDIANAVRGKLLQEGALQALLRNVNECDEVWTVSRGAGDNLRSLGFEGDYIVMPNGVDLPHEPVSAECVHEATAGYDLPEDVPCYLFIGRLMWYKGLRIILDALKKLKDSDIDFRMVFVGGGGDEPEVRAYTAESGLDSKVFFTGAISQRETLRAWYSRADLFLFPSTFDTNGLVVREAAASDTASVIIKDSCASEGVTDGRNGFLIEENADSLAAKLTLLASEPESVRTVGCNAGRELYISWEHAVARAYDRYETVIDRFRCGSYRKHDPIKGSWMQSQGELMQILGDIQAAGKDIRQDVESLHSDLDMNMRSLRNHALTDIITAGYEARQEIESKRKEVRSELNALRRDIHTQLKEAGDDIWEYLERYL